MSKTLSLVSFAALAAGAAPALAEAPRVAVDIAPVHSLVARVMEGVGTPDLVIPPGASPHEYSLRPSEASALQAADLVFWVGADLTPWLEDAIGTLAEGAEVRALLEAEGVTLLEFRESALFEAHDHGHDHGDHDHDHGETASAEADHDHDHDHDEDHADASHDHDHDHDETAAAHDDHGHDDHAGHDHGAHDPHAWLSPANAEAWLDVIAGDLSAADPDNADTYAANAEAARAELDALRDDIAATLEPVADLGFIVFHDAYQYFETAFDVPASGAISVAAAEDPSPARVAEIQDRIRNENIDCVLAEPQYNPGLVATVAEGTGVQTGVLDPLGSDLEPGPELYPHLLRNLADTLADCA